MSQPEIYSISSTLKRTLSVPGRTRRKKIGISERDRDAKIKEFELYVSKNDFTSDEFKIETVGNNKTVFFSYFIGRLNPPHRGHVSALINLVRTAKRNRSMALILFGSGPKQSNGERRTMDDPITFETKKAFVVSKLIKAGGKEGVDFTIKEMTSPHADVTHYIGSRLNEINGVIREIHITHIAGGKDDDASKLNSVLVYVADVARKEVPEAQVSAEVGVAAPPTPEKGSVEATYMSATNVRKDAFKTLLPDGGGYADWPTEYKTFYGPRYARVIYDEILYPLEKISDASELEEAIRDYIDPKPKAKSNKSKTRKKIDDFSRYPKRTKISQ